MKKITVLALLSLIMVITQLPISAEPVTITTEGEEVATFEERPYASHFFPKDFLEWSFETDPDAIHNVSSVPLNKRIQGDKMNPDQSTEAKVASLAIVNKNTSGTPSQGSDKKEIYNFTNWQYIDVLVAWAGSAGEGIIVPPSSDVIDVAHKNGVPVLGTVFFPPLAYGGEEKWLDEFLIKDKNGNFPVADKLIEMANIYGFDGWFINQETDSSNTEHGVLFQEFLTYYQKNKPSNHDVMWYDSMLENGRVSWQNQLNNNNKMFFQKENQKMSDRFFLNFWWKNQNLEVDRLINSSKLAKELGRSPFDVYAGIDVQGVGTKSFYLPSDIKDEQGNAMLSLGLYAPDWTLRDGAHENVDKYWANEQVFWINEAGDPRDTSLDKRKWQGISRHFVEKSAVTKLPFVTHFNTGHGDNQFNEGIIVKEGTFNNRSIQDILPTYRWVIDQKNNHLKASFDYENVFTGGTSVKLSGKTVADETTNIKLYATELKLSESNIASLVYKGNAETDLVLHTEKEEIILTAKDIDSINGWTKKTYDLSQYEGKTIKSIDVRVITPETLENDEIYLGEIKILEHNNYLIQNINNFKVIGKTVDDNISANLRLSWDHDGENVDRYNVYTNSNGVWDYQGATSNTSYYVENIMRGETANVDIKVIPVDLNGNEINDKAVTTHFTFDKIELPTGNFEISSTFVATQEEILLTANASSSTKEISWRIDDAEIVEQTDYAIKVKFAKSGIYDVQMILSNEAGSTTVHQEKIISVYDDSFPYELKNLALDVVEENVKVSNSCAAHEAGPGALDGDMTTKWCDNKSDKPTMEIKLENISSIVGFKLHHAEAGGENKEWNTRDYEIFTSLDGENWNQVVHKNDNVDAVSLDSISLTETEYIKLVLNKAEQTGNTARIYEFEILGYEAVDIKVNPLQDELNELRTVYYDYNIDLSEFTDDSKQSLVQYLEEAKTILEMDTIVDNIDKHRENILELITNLHESAEKLVEKVDVYKAELQELLNSVSKLDAGSYEEDSYQILQNQVLIAKKLLNDENSSVEEIISAIENINKAKANLKDKVNPIPPVTNPDENDQNESNLNNNVNDNGNNTGSDSESDHKQDKDNGSLPTTGQSNAIINISLLTILAGVVIKLIKKNDE